MNSIDLGRTLTNPSPLAVADLASSDHDMDGGCSDKIVLALLQHFHCGGVIFDARGAVTAVNEAALFILTDESEQHRGDEATPELTAPVSEKLQFLIGRSREVVQPMGQNTPHRIYQDETRFLIIYRFPVDLPAGRTLLAIMDMNRRMLPQPQVLKLLFDLTPAEILLARGIAKGSAPAELASLTRISRTTVRSQLASLFSKTQTHRQPELVALLARAALVR
ncbi:hypothetical protein JMJ55_27505 [Belnapia sp. T6]|uniref:HTH luxR-type domain-containing protein n=1 Tax=Belnapia mucosa TaxID=2804532 RepID=A0ABS1VED4_9PROT|nr:hypothetical protein [Belnapia mucosa]MBL6459079.1 hypothetical protein [Belnapia mucosa]